jgi:hypothetical protein
MYIVCVKVNVNSMCKCKCKQKLNRVHTEQITKTNEHPKLHGD